MNKILNEQRFSQPQEVLRHFLTPFLTTAEHSGVDSTPDWPPTGCSAPPSAVFNGDDMTVIERRFRRLNFPA